MPIYEYECAKCRKKFELRRSMSDKDSGVECPECGKKGARRIFSVFGTTSASSPGSGCAPRAKT